MKVNKLGKGIIVIVIYVLSQTVYTLAPHSGLDEGSIGQAHSKLSLTLDMWLKSPDFQGGASVMPLNQEKSEEYSEEEEFGAIEEPFKEQELEEKREQCKSQIRQIAIYDGHKRGLRRSPFTESTGDSEGIDKIKRALKKSIEAINNLEVLIFLRRYCRELECCMESVIAERIRIRLKEEGIQTNRFMIKETAPESGGTVIRSLEDLVKFMREKQVEPSGEREEEGSGKVFLSTGLSVRIPEIMKNFLSSGQMKRRGFIELGKEECVRIIEISIAVTVMGWEEEREVREIREDQLWTVADIYQLKSICNETEAIGEVETGAGEGLILSGLMPSELMLSDEEESDSEEDGRSSTFSGTEESGSEEDERLSMLSSEEESSTEEDERSSIFSEIEAEIGRKEESWVSILVSKDLKNKICRIMSQKQESYQQFLLRDREGNQDIYSEQVAMKIIDDKRLPWVDLVKYLKEYKTLSEQEVSREFLEYNLKQELKASFTGTMKLFIKLLKELEGPERQWFLKNEVVVGFIVENQDIQLIEYLEGEKEMITTELSMKLFLKNEHWREMRINEYIWKSNWKNSELISQLLERHPHQLLEWIYLSKKERNKQEQAEQVLLKWKEIMEGRNKDLVTELKSSLMGRERLPKHIFIRVIVTRDKIIFGEKTEEIVKCLLGEKDFWLGLSQKEYGEWYKLGRENAYRYINQIMLSIRLKEEECNRLMRRLQSEEYHFEKLRMVEEEEGQDQEISMLEVCIKLGRTSSKQQRFRRVDKKGASEEQEGELLFEEEGQGQGGSVLEACKKMGRTLGKSPRFRRVNKEEELFEEQDDELLFREGGGISRALWYWGGENPGIEKYVKRVIKEVREGRKDVLGQKFLKKVIQVLVRQLALKENHTIISEFTGVIAGFLANRIREIETVELLVEEVVVIRIIGCKNQEIRDLMLSNWLPQKSQGVRDKVIRGRYSRYWYLVDQGVIPKESEVFRKEESWPEWKLEVLEADPWYFIARAYEAGLKQEHGGWKYLKSLTKESWEKVVVAMNSGKKLYDTVWEKGDKEEIQVEVRKICRFLKEIIITDKKLEEKILGVLASWMEKRVFWELVGSTEEKSTLEGWVLNKEKTQGTSEIWDNILFHEEEVDQVMRVNCELISLWIPSWTAKGVVKILKRLVEVKGIDKVRGMYWWRIAIKGDRQLAQLVGKESPYNEEIVYSPEDIVEDWWCILNLGKIDKVQVLKRLWEKEYVDNDLANAFKEKVIAKIKVYIENGEGSILEEIHNIIQLTPLEEDSLGILQILLDCMERMKEGAVEEIRQSMPFKNLMRQISQEGVETDILLEGYITVLEEVGPEDKEEDSRIKEGSLKKAKENMTRVVAQLESKEVDIAILWRGLARLEESRYPEYIYQLSRETILQIEAWRKLEVRDLSSEKDHNVGRLEYQMGLVEMLRSKSKKGLEAYTRAMNQWVEGQGAGDEDRIVEVLWSPYLRSKETKEALEALKRVDAEQGEGLMGVLRENWYAKGSGQRIQSCDLEELVLWADINPKNRLGQEAIEEIARRECEGGIRVRSMPMYKKLERIQNQEVQRLVCRMKEKGSQRIYRDMIVGESEPEEISEEKVKERLEYAILSSEEEEESLSAWINICIPQQLMNAIEEDPKNLKKVLGCLWTEGENYIHRYSWRIPDCEKREPVGTLAENQEEQKFVKKAAEEARKIVKKLEKEGRIAEADNFKEGWCYHNEVVTFGEQIRSKSHSDSDSAEKVGRSDTKVLERLEKLKGYLEDKNQEEVEVEMKDRGLGEKSITIPRRKIPEEVRLKARDTSREKRFERLLEAGELWSQDGIKRAIRIWVESPGIDRESKVNNVMFPIILWALQKGIVSFKEDICQGKDLDQMGKEPDSEYSKIETLCRYIEKSTQEGTLTKLKRQLRKFFRIGQLLRRLKDKVSGGGKTERLSSQHFVQDYMSDIQRSV